MKNKSLLEYSLITTKTPIRVPLNNNSGGIFEAKLTENSWRPFSHHKNGVHKAFQFMKILFASCDTKLKVNRSLHIHARFAPS